MADFLTEFQNNLPEIITALVQHIGISTAAIILGIIAAVPAGIWLTYHGKTAKVVLGIFGVVNTIPSIVLLGVAMIVLGIGYAPAIAVLFLYSLLPILRATYTGIREVSPRCIKAAKGMGMSQIQMLRQVQLPLALPSIITGIRLSTIYIISWATLAAFIGGGGLGDLIWMGLQSYSFGLVFCGAIPATILSLVASALLNMVIKRANKHKSEGVAV